jgi:hypothetical protein
MRAEAEYTTDGVLRRLVFRKDNGSKHREGAPAYRSYYPNGRLRVVGWSMNGKRHREDGPAYTSYLGDGRPFLVQWYFKGSPHRLDGPAYTVYHTSSGQVVKYSWYLYGRRYTEDEYREILELHDSIITINQAIIYIKHSCEYIRLRCQEILNEN